jgi:flagellar biosynthetic protein FliP
MLLAMAVGMLVVGGARSAVGLDVAFAAHPGGSYLLMATDMAVGMAAWMWLRRHAWVVTLEMCLAMYLPVVLLPLVRANALSTTAFMVLAHTLMVVAMVVVLVRHHRGLTVDGTGVR